MEIHGYPWKSIGRMVRAAASTTLPRDPKGVRNKNPSLVALGNLTPNEPKSDRAESGHRARTKRKFQKLQTVETGGPLLEETCKPSRQNANFLGRIDNERITARPPGLIFFQKTLKERQERVEGESEHSPILCLYHTTLKSDIPPTQTRGLHR